MHSFDFLLVPIESMCIILRRGVSKMPLFVCGCREIAIFCMWGSRKCNFWYVGVSKSPCYVRISKTPCPRYMRVSKKYNTLPFPIFNLNSPYPLPRKYVHFTSFCFIHFYYDIGSFYLGIWTIFVQSKFFLLVFIFAASADTSV